jgi:dUTP pyrophosphatase
MQINTSVDDYKCVPVRAHFNDAGADLVSKESKTVTPGEQYMFDTGVRMEIPSGFAGFIFNRSSQGKIGITIPNSVGVIDSQYRGNLKVILRNDGKESYKVEAFKTKIAQLVILPVALATFNLVDALDETQRGSGGFGSTGA